MEIRARIKEGVAILDLFGRIDADSANFIEVVGQCLRDGYCNILCNFEEVDFIDYTGISAIIIAYKEVINNKGRMKFFNLPIHIKQLLSVAGVDKVIDIFAREDLAINAFKEDRVIENIKKLQLRRRFQRLPIDIKIRLAARHDRKIEFLELELLDLSAVGAYIFGCDKFRLGDEVVLNIDLSSEKQKFELNARVVWLSDKDIQHQIHPGMGVEFYNISSDVQERLVKFIEKNLSFTKLE